MIEHAKKCAPPQEIESGEIVGGFAHAQVLALADQIVEAVRYSLWSSRSDHESYKDRIYTTEQSDIRDANIFREQRGKRKTFLL